MKELLGTIFKNGFMHVSRVKSAVTGDKEFVVFGRNKTKTGAIIVPVTKEGKVILVKEYRVGGDVYTIGVPKGAADEVGESALSIAQRELREEMGASFSKVVETRLVAYPLPAFADFCGQVVFAYDVEITGSSDLEEGECIEVFGEFAPSAIFEMLSDGTINDAESAMALQSYLLKDSKAGDFQ